jgi:hypothetical protein
MSDETMVVFLLSVVEKPTPPAVLLLKLDRPIRWQSSGSGDPSRAE